MGTYDTVHIKCPYCGKNTHSQTKALGDCTLESININHELDSDEYSGVFELKETCECLKPLRIKINKGIIIESTKDSPNYIEKAYGEVEKIK